MPEKGKEQNLTIPSPPLPHSLQQARPAGWPGPRAMSPELATHGLSLLSSRFAGLLPALTLNTLSAAGRLSLKPLLLNQGVNI